MAFLSQPAKGMSGGGQSGTSAPGGYLTARKDLSTSGLTDLVTLTLCVCVWQGGVCMCMGTGVR